MRAACCVLRGGANLHRRRGEGHDPHGRCGRPLPASESARAYSALGLWLFVPWSWWVDKHMPQMNCTP